jgi:hypothetical protein
LRFSRLQLLAEADFSNLPRMYFTNWSKKFKKLGKLLHLNIFVKNSKQKGITKELLRNKSSISNKFKNKLSCFCKKNHFLLWLAFLYEIYI